MVRRVLLEHQVEGSDVEEGKQEDRLEVKTGCLTPTSLNT